MYYRVAMQIHSSPEYQWKSTLLSSLDTLLRWLRLHQALPQNQLWIFSSRTREDLSEQLARENKGLEVNSVTAEQFLRDRKLGSPKEAVAAAKRREQPVQREQARGSLAAITRPLWNEYSGEVSSSNERSINALEKRRQELEQGAGGDHDSPYTFTLPTFTPQALAWMQLLVRVRNGELEA